MHSFNFNPHFQMSYFLTEEGQMYSHMKGSALDLPMTMANQLLIDPQGKMPVGVWVKELDLQSLYQPDLPKSEQPVTVGSSPPLCGKCLGFHNADTPVTDSATWQGHCGDRDWGPVVYAGIAQKLERERDQARRIACNMRAEKHEFTGGGEWLFPWETSLNINRPTMGKQI